MAQTDRAESLNAQVDRADEEELSFLSERIALSAERLLAVRPAVVPTAAGRRRSIDQRLRAAHHMAEPAVGQ